MFLKSVIRIFPIVLLLPVGLLGQLGSIKGIVTDANTNDPIGFATVKLAETSQGTITEEDGRFEISGIEPGFYTIVCEFLGYKTETLFEIQIGSSRPVEVNFALESTSTELEEVVVRAPVFKETPESPLSLRNIGVTEIQRNPGSNRDISRVIQSFPGVTSTASFRNDLLIRGGGPGENRFFVNGIETPTINHFATQGASGGPAGILNVQLINDVDFYSSAFPANRGNALSSVLDFRLRDGRDDAFGGSFIVSATDIGVTAEGPIGDRTTYLVSLRRSYLGLLFDALGLPFLPTYNDAQVVLTHKPNSKNEIRFTGIGSLDDFKLNLDANDTEEKQFLLENLPVAPQWSYTAGITYKNYGEKGYWTTVVSRNTLHNEAVKYQDNDESSEDNLILDYESEETETKFRFERTQRGKYGKLNLGVGYQFVQYRNSTFNRIFTSSGPQTINFSSDISFHRYALFGQISKEWFDDRLSASFGFRLDGASYSDDMSNPLDQFSPRVSLSYKLRRGYTINATSGIYYQLPPYTVLGYEEAGTLVNKENNIQYIRNFHAAAGISKTTGWDAKISVEAYYKKYDNYPFLLRDSISLANLGGDFGVVGNEPAVPTSEGRTYGLEVMYQQRLYKGFYGILAYTLGRSEFQDKNGEYVPSSWDARHIVNLTLGKKLPKNWEVGINWRFQTGIPTTPFDPNSSLVINWDVNNSGIPDFDRINSERLETSNTIDIRVDKKWFFKGWSLNVFLDIENLTGNAVPENQLILDRPLDENGMPIGGGVIVNPDAPMNEQRYALKPLGSVDGTILPSIGITLEF